MYVEIRSVTEENERHRNRSGRGAERGDRDAQLELPHQLFQHEYRPGDRRVEGGGKAGACAGREQHAAIRPAAAEYDSHEAADDGRHLHARPLAAERQPATDCQQPAEELDRDQAKRRRLELLVQHRLDVGNAAARGATFVPANQPGSHGGRGGASCGHEQEA